MQSTSQLYRLLLLMGYDNITDIMWRFYPTLEEIIPRSCAQAFSLVLNALLLLLFFTFAFDFASLPLIS